MQGLTFLMAFFFLGLSAQAQVPAQAVKRLSPLAPEPDWASLARYQQTITRAAFTHQVDTLYAPDSAAVFWRYATIDDHEAVFFIDEAHTKPVFHLHFAASAKEAHPVPTTAFPKLDTDPAHPLAPLVICLDPGHIGGEWARMEERFFQVHNDRDRPILEADLNLWACRHAATLLEKAGARVVWTKTDNQPVTPLRPADLRFAALQALIEEGYVLPTLPPALLEQRLRVSEEKLFYRTAEIQARAERVAQLKPDLTICVHFNAASWGDPNQPTFVPQSRLVVFVHGQYMADELQYEDERYDLIRKCLEQTAPIELAVAEKVAAQMSKTFAMPPEEYKDWPAVRPIGHAPGLYARNLLASRLFPGPVVFVEGPYMNADDAYPRLEAGDYEGERLVAGKMQPSIFAEYGQAIAQALIAYATGK